MLDRFQLMKKQIQNIISKIFPKTRFYLESIQIDLVSHKYEMRITLKVLLEI